MAGPHRVIKTGSLTQTHASRQKYSFALNYIHFKANQYQS